MILIRNWVIIYGRICGEGLGLWVEVVGGCNKLSNFVDFFGYFLMVKFFI